MENMDSIWYLKRCSLFEGLGDTSLESISSHTDNRTIPPGTLLTGEMLGRDHVFVVFEGRIEMSHMLEDGRKAVLCWLTPGDFWGMFGPDDSPGPADHLVARTVEPTRLLTYTRPYFERMLERRPKIAVRLMRLLGLRQRRYEVRLTGLLFRSNRQKLANLFLDLSEGGKPLAFSHEEFGTMVGITREQVTRLIGELCLKGIIESKRRKLLVLDRARLADVAEGRED